MTIHDCQSWNTHRATLIDLAHEVDGLRYVGGRGQRLEPLVERTYQDEALQLSSDLAECLSALPGPLAEQLLREVMPAIQQAAGHRPPPAFIPDPEPAPEGDRPLGTDEQIEQEITEAIEKASEGRGRGRRKPDAAAALADQRTHDTGALPVIVEPI